MSRAYAADTSVSIDRTQGQIERLLADAGATSFVRGWQDGRVALGFTIQNRQVRIDLPMPELADVARTPTGLRRTEAQARAELVKEERRRWRSLFAVLKAKLVAVEDGISTIEREFLADVVLPDGSTVGQWSARQLEATYATAQMPALLPGGVS